MYFFTSDTHFYDYDTLLMDDRPFATAEEFDNLIGKVINKDLKKNSHLKYDDIE